MGRSVRLGWLLIGSILVLTIGSHRPTSAQFGGAGGGFGQAVPPDPAEGPAPRIHVAIPYSEAAVRITGLLDRPITMPFDSDTPLGDALEYIRQATAEAEGGMEQGIPIYVDEIGLQDAEQSLQSPIRISLEGIPLKTTLRLMLDQLDLVYEVLPEGLLLITSKESENSAADPMLLLLDEVRALRAEVRELKGLIEARPESRREASSGK
ncbi:hypothetical protein [Tautonia plasticadhaerens]|nr:hypothetical protein [Tautonia plasticadhaerens]